MKARLFVQGGGMRGVYSLAALARLDELGLHERFDVVEGASAGAINGSYFVTRQAREAVGLYTEMAGSKEFIRFSRPHRILDVDFLVDTVLKQHYPLDLDSYRNSPTEMRTIVTSVATGAEFVVTNRTPGVDVYELLRATAALPLLYHRKVNVAGREYVDGGVSRALPTIADLEDERPLLVVLTRPAGFRTPPPSRTVRGASVLRARSMSPAVRQTLNSGYLDFNRTMAHLEQLGPDRNVCVVQPPSTDVIATRTTRDRDLVLNTVKQARADLEQTLETCEWL